jgi:predicted dithiol-disulfide oxidoreductase (DUF899 family)
LDLNLKGGHFNEDTPDRLVEGVGGCAPATLVKEKELTRARDALAAERRRMPWLAVEKQYEFDGPKGKASLLDLFEGRRQLIVYRAFVEPGVFGWPEHACHSRGDEAMGTTWSYLDITPLGRQETWEDSPEGYPQTPPYKWWNWHDNYNVEASPDPKWVEVSDAGEAALRKRDGEAKA